MICCTKIQFKIKINTIPNFDFKLLNGPTQADREEMHYSVNDSVLKWYSYASFSCNSEFSDVFRVNIYFIHTLISQKFLPSLYVHTQLLY